MDAKILVEALRDAGYSVRSYSGRGMYGRSCVGAELERGTGAFKVASDVAAALLDTEVGAHALIRELADLRVCEDSLGLGSILYFPQVPWEQGSPEPEDDAE
jgi:hypothetical protein